MHSRTTRWSQHGGLGDGNLCRGGRVGAPLAVEWNAHWQIEESDFGALMVFHKHQAETVTAYLWTDAEGVTEAQCSLCGRKVRVEPPLPSSVMELPVGS